MTTDHDAPESHLDPPRIRSFRDALGLAMELADEYAFANAAVLLTRDGRIDDLTIAEGIGRTIEPVVSWVTDARGVRFGPTDGAQPASGRLRPLAHRSPTEAATPAPEARHSRQRPDRANGPVSSVVLVSVRPYESDIVRERDLELYREANWALARAGVGLADWIETDGDLFRSYAYLTCPARAWTDDPPTERLADADL